MVDPLTTALLGLLIGILLGMAAGIVIGRVESRPAPRVPRIWIQIEHVGVSEGERLRRNFQRAQELKVKR